MPKVTELGEPMLRLPEPENKIPDELCPICAAEMLPYNKNLCKNFHYIGDETRKLYALFMEHDKRMEEIRKRFRDKSDGRTVIIGGDGK